MPTITLNDGRRVTVDDAFTGLTPDQQQETVNDIAAKLGPMAPPQRSVMDRIKGLYHSAEEGVTGAVMGTLASPRTAVEGLYQLQDIQRKELGLPQQKREPTAIERYYPTAEDFRKSYETSYGGEPRYTPKDFPEKLTETAGGFAAGGAGGGGGLFTRLSRIVAPTVGSEVAGKLAEGTPYEPIAKLGGALTGSGAVGAARKLAPTSVLEKGLAGITSSHINDAGKLMQDATARGVDLTWPEALSQVTGRPVLADTMRQLEAAPQTKAQMDQFFGPRPQQVEQAVKAGTQQISPGVMPAPSNIGPEIGRSAESTMRDVEKLRTQAVNPYYQAAKTDVVPHPEIKAVVDDIDQRIANDKTGVLRGPLSEFRNLLVERPAQAAVPPQRVARQTPAGTIYDTIPGTPAVPEQLITDIGNLDRARKYVREKMDMPQSGQDAITKEQGKVILESLNDLQSRMIKASPNLQKGQQLFEDISQKYVNPLKERLLGQLADKDLGTRQAIGKVFAREPLADSHPEVTEAIGAVANKSPKAASDLVRNYLETAYNSAARDLQTGPNQASGAKFRAAVAGNPQQRTNLQAAVEALPNGADRWNGFNRLLDIMEATGTRQNVGSRTAYNIEAMREFQPGTAAKTAASAMTRPWEVLKPINDKFNEWRTGRNMTQMANILTDPKSADMLRKIAASPRGGSRELNLARALVYGTVLGGREKQ
jgi:hypothetical protein